MDTTASHADTAVRTVRDWRVVVPVKARHLAKSRLHPPAGLHRSDLAHAFALDTIGAVTDTLPPGHLVVVTSDLQTRDFALTRSALVVQDQPDGQDAHDRLNGAIRTGLRALLRQSGDGPTAVLLGDLPALTASELATALSECAQWAKAFVPDADGTGTVLLAARRGADVVPHFGSGSAAAHEQHGYERLALDLPALRTDVDDDVSLRAARAIGVGRHTQAALAAAPASGAGS